MKITLLLFILYKVIYKES